MKPEKREKLQTVRNEMEAFMKRSVPFWLEHGIDREYGGIWSALTAMASDEGTGGFIAG